MLHGSPWAGGSHEPLRFYSAKFSSFGSSPRTHSYVMSLGSIYRIISSGISDLI